MMEIYVVRHGIAVPSEAGIPDRFRPLTSKGRRRFRRTARRFARLGRELDLFSIADQLISAKINHIDQTFRMRHTDGHWIWLRVRCELSQATGDSGLHLIGIAVDITEQKSLAEKTIEADLRLRDAIETIPEAFVLWDAGDRLVLCNSHFQRLHKLPDSAVTPGTSYETVIEVGRMPEVRTRVHEVANRAPGAKTS